ncbi:MAG TPA: Cof-type HAD-IIB family hydrolase [Symbiobacteriaceae bacterium]|nr:Cof-type HAD-IIB family hydrolase [Symbiobacteriaceae bacterium]
MPYRLIALDLDGTLLSPGPRGPWVSPRTHTSLQEARAAGVHIVVATGRSVHSAREWSQRIGGGPFVCCNGAALIGADGQTIQFRLVPKEPLCHLIKVAEAAGALVECYTPDGIALDKPLHQVSSYLRWIRETTPLWKAMIGLVRMWRTNRVRIVRSLSQWATTQARPAVLKVMIVGEPATLPALRERIERECPTLTISSSGKDNLEVTAAGVTKASGLRALGDHLKVPAAAMMAFGDSFNDLEMLDFVGLGVAMGNAREPIKQAAKRVTAPNHQDGIALVVEELILRAPPAPQTPSPKERD